MGPCIEWAGLRFASGYGRLSTLESRRSGHLRAHRWAYEKFYGPIPTGMVVMHGCDNPPCIHPLHLTKGTEKDNKQDCAAKGRFAMQKVTQCPAGHPYSRENTLREKTVSGIGRKCRICVRARIRRWKQAHPHGANNVPA